MTKLSSIATIKIQDIIHSPATITTIVDILTIVSDLSPRIKITQPILQVSKFMCYSNIIEFILNEP